ncbi:nitroreductase family protein [Actinoplanes sp. CA-030573]|uniref:nitroreductase family protein n=1 Tax=Actinoplanes sp. CA-030573 TaxID=3239898 RepID=UPI003D9056FC
MSDLTPEQLLTTTRSVRKRLDLKRPVPLPVVLEYLETALQAPSGSNRQGWHWMVVTDPAKRAVIGDHYRAAVASYSASAGAAGKLFSADAARARVQNRVGDSVAYLGEHLAEVPVHVIGCLDTGAEELPKGNQAGLWGSLLPAAWSYMLAARTRGLGTAWTTLHLRYEREISELLGIPPSVHQGVLIPTAYYTGTSFRPAPRQPLTEVLHLESW